MAFRHVSLPIAAMALFALAGCRAEEGGTFTVAVIGDAPSLADPADGPLSEPQRTLLANVAQGLVRLDPRGQIVPGLAERWTVSDDGLSWIFRLSGGEWPDGRDIRARDIARILTRQLSRSSRNELKDTLGAVEEVVAMTDRVVEIRLAAPRPNLLALLAQPEFALVREGQGTGPFTLDEEDERKGGEEAYRRLRRVLFDRDGFEEAREEIRLTALPAVDAIRQFEAGKLDLVLGGRLDTLPLARSASLPRGSLRFDPVPGLLGLVPVRDDGVLADAPFRRLLNAAIDREALIAALEVDRLLPRTTLLQAGLDGLGDPAAPDWATIPRAERLSALRAEAQRLFGATERPTLRVSVPAGPGGDILLARLTRDWAEIGIRVEAAKRAGDADLLLVDAVAPSTSPGWYLRRFRCERVAICLPEADLLLDEARKAPLPEQRATIFAEVARMMEEAQLFLPIAAPVRWNLVGPRALGYADNAVAVHSLAGLGTKLERERAD